MAQEISYLPYHEPGIITILIQSSFLLVLNALNSIFDNLIYCGLLAQVFVGVAWGIPGGNILGREFENVVVQLGYLGLILLVYEGGLSTNLTQLRSNLLLSSAVAITGIALPIALSFTLSPLLNATPIQCFAAGAALCATSLGTTFTILRTSGLVKSRLGVVLASAAMMDDVIGLVMVQIIANLGTSSTGNFSWKTAVRPLGVSLGFAIGVPFMCWTIVRPFVTQRWTGRIARVVRWEHTPLILQTLFLTGMVTAAIYAGTSSLFAAYLAGAVVSWWDGVRRPDIGESGAAKDAFTSNNTATMHRSIAEENTAAEGAATTTHSSMTCGRATSGLEVYEKYYATALHRVLKPFFFASIGFAIPITDMFSGQIVWRGLIYTILMLIAKLCTGLWLVRFNVSAPRIQVTAAVRQLLEKMGGCLSTKNQTKQKRSNKITPCSAHLQELEIANRAFRDTDTVSGAGQLKSATHHEPSTVPAQTSKISKPLSLYPASMLGTAMTARGEIGFLIASVAASTGLFDSGSPSGREHNGSSEIHLVVIWAVVLCTIIGPLSVGSLVRRVKRLEGQHVGERRIDGPLGIWGLS